MQRPWGRKEFADVAKGMGDGRQQRILARILFSRIKEVTEV